MFSSIFRIHKSMEKKAVRNGFTLLEMIIVVSIIVVLASIAAPRFMTAGDKAKIAKVQADVRTISDAAEIYRFDTGTYPATVAVLTEVNEKTQDSYLKFAPKQPDGTEYSIQDGVVSGVYNDKTYTSDNPEGTKTTE